MNQIFLSGTVMGVDSTNPNGVVITLDSKEDTFSVVAMGTTKEAAKKFEEGDFINVIGHLVDNKKEDHMVILVADQIEHIGSCSI